MAFANFLRPGRFDVAEGGDDLIIRQKPSVNGHVGFVVGIADQRASPVFGQTEQRIPVMVPRMTGRVVRRRG